MEIKESSATKPTDLSLYDRQVRLWGLSAQQKIHMGSVLVIHPNVAIAHEIIKNLALMGIGSITLLHVLEFKDKLALFYQNTDEIPCFELLTRRINMLNPSVIVKEHFSYGENTNQPNGSGKVDLNTFSVVLYCNPYITSPSTNAQSDQYEFNQVILWNELCRNSHVPFYYCGALFPKDTTLCYGFAFCDFMSDYVWTDPVTLKDTSIPFVSLNRSVSYLDQKQTSPSLGHWLKLHKDCTTNGLLQDDSLRSKDELVPIISILGAQSSHDIIHCITRQGNVLTNLFIFDPSSDSVGQIHVCWPQSLQKICSDQILDLAESEEE
jgi:hypothetical protein